MSLHLITEALITVPVADGDLIGFASNKVSAVEVLLRSFAVLVAIGFVIHQAIQSRGAMARIVISGLAAAMFVWIVFNVTDLKNRVDTEMNGSGSLTSTVTVPGPRDA